MSGLDKMNSHILEEANQTAAAKLAEAREKAERIVAEGRDLLFRDRFKTDTSGI